MATASDRAVINFVLTGGDLHDFPISIFLLDKIKKLPEHKYVLMDRAYSGENVRSKIIQSGYIPVVPPKRNRRNPWEYDKSSL